MTTNYVSNACLWLPLSNYGMKKILTVDWQCIACSEVFTNEWRTTEVKNIKAGALSILTKISKEQIDKNRSTATINYINKDIN